MRLAAFGAGLLTAIAVSACGYATAPTPATAFSLADGNYTLKIGGSGICGGVLGSSLEGSAPVIVTRSGTAWSVKPNQAGDSFAMSLTTDGAAAGSVRGDMSGVLTVDGGRVTSVGPVTGANAGSTVGGPTSGVSFLAPSGLATSTCLSGTWTLSPR